MTIRFLAILISATVLNCQIATGQNFFWSDLGLGDGAINDDATIETSVGATGTAYLYYESNGQDISDGLDLDFSWDVNDVIAFTAAETFEADIIAGDPAIDDRWGDAFGPAADVSPNDVTGFFAVNVVNGTGILESNIPGVLSGNYGIDFIDILFDQSAGAFLVGSVDYEALTAGITTLQVDGLVVNNGVNIGVPFSNLTFISVPEPTSAFLFSLLGVLSVAIRRRQNN